MNKIGELISAIEDAGITIQSISWDITTLSLNIDVPDADQERAGNIANEYWLSKQAERLGFVAVGD